VFKVSTSSMLLVAGCALMEAPARGASAQDSRGQRVFRHLRGGAWRALGGGFSRGRRAPAGPAPGPLANERALLWVFGLLGLAGAVLLIVSDESVLIQVKVLTVTSASELGSRAKTYGHAEHAYAMTVLGAAALPMLYGAIRGRSRPALGALIVLGVIGLVIALAIDVPDSSKTGVIGQDFADARATAQIGLKLELLGAGLLVICGGCLLIIGVGGGGGGRDGGGGGGDRGDPRRRADPA